MKIYEIVVHSTTQKNTWYHIEIFKDPDIVKCDCRAGRIHGFCRHIKFYKKLIDHLLTKNPAANNISPTNEINKTTGININSK